MLRHKALFFGGLLVVAVSLFVAVGYRDAIVETTLGFPLLTILAVTGAATATAVFFYERLERSTESFRSSEKLLQDSEARFRQLFDISPFPATVTSLKDNRVLAVNQRAADRFGIPQSQAVG